MSLGLWPDAVPFDPEHGTASHDLRARLDLEASPAAMLLVTGGAQRRSRWAASAAAAIARALAEAGQQVVLADLDFEAPTLHTLFGEANAEGVADVLLFGASLERVVTRPAGESFDLLAPGAFAPDPVEIMLDAGWARVLGDIETSGGTFLGYLAADAPGAALIANRIGTVIVLADEAEVPAALARLPETILLRAMVRPADPQAVSVEPVVPSAGEEVVEARVVELAPAVPASMPPDAGESAVENAGESGQSPSDGGGVPADLTLRAMIEDLRERQRAANARTARAEGDGEAAHMTLQSLPTPDVAPASRRMPPRQRTPRWQLALLGVAVLAVLIGGPLFGRRYLASRAERDEQGGAVSVDPAAQAEPRGRPLTYSVAIESFDQLARAVQRADSLAGVSPGVSFYVAPFRLDEATYYRVLAGPLADSASGAALMTALVAQGAKTAENASDVRETPLAFLIGAYDVRVDADARMHELRESGVPSYVVEVPYTRGPARYHLYAGAYGVPSEAEVLRALLRTAGVPDTLVVRIGQVGT